MHLEPWSTGLSSVAINRNKEIGLSCMLLCYICIEKHTIQKSTIHKANEQDEAPKIENNLELLEVKLISLIAERKVEVFRVSCNEMQNSFCEIAAKMSKQLPKREFYQNRTTNKP